MKNNQFNYHKSKTATTFIENRWFKILNIIILAALILIGFLT